MLCGVEVNFIDNSMLFGEKYFIFFFHNDILIIEIILLFKGGFNGG